MANIGKKFEFKIKDYKEVSRLAGIGLTIAQTAAIFRMSKSSFELYMAEDPKLKEAIDQGRADALDKVATILWELATEKKIPSAIYFYMKCRGGWKETVAVEQKDSKGFSFKKTDA